MIGRRVVRAVLAADAEAHGVGDRIGDPGERRADFRRRAAKRVEREVGANRGVAAGDVEADADDGHLVAVGRDATDRHDVAHVAVGHEGCVHCLFANVLELDERLFFVLSEDLHGSI